MKVILDFPNLREDPSISRHLEQMIKMAKEAKGFLFFVDRGGTTGMQMYMISNAGLVTLIDSLERENPGVKYMREMLKMQEKFGDFLSRRDGGG